jgi:hypothetical protein
VAHLVTGKSFTKEYSTPDSLIVFRSLTRLEYLAIKRRVATEELTKCLCKASTVFVDNMEAAQALVHYEDFERVYGRLLAWADKGFSHDTTVRAILKAIEGGTLDPHSVESSPRWTLAVKLALGLVGRSDVTRDASSLSEEERLEIVNKYNHTKLPS